MASHCACGPVFRRGCRWGSSFCWLAQVILMQKFRHLIYNFFEIGISISGVELAVAEVDFTGHAPQSLLQ